MDPGITWGAQYCYIAAHMALPCSATGSAGRGGLGAAAASGGSSDLLASDPILAVAVKAARDAEGGAVRALIGILLALGPLTELHSGQRAIAMAP